MPTALSRRSFLARSGLSGAALALGGAWSTKASAGAATAGEGPYGPLTREPDANGLLLPTGFSSRLIGTSNAPVAETGYAWHLLPDGGACFADEGGGWIYVSNSEALNNSGGVSAVRFAPDGSIVEAYRILEGTNVNCAGGPTPWGTWLSCEEFDLHGADPALAEAAGSIAGRVWECDPTQAGQGEARPALGLFQHEAVAVDPTGERLYLTEDRPDGLLYRFTPEAYPDVGSGTLEAALIEGDTVQWIEVPDPTGADQRLAEQLGDQVTHLSGGEGIWFHEGVVYFTNKGDNRVHAVDAATDRYELLYDAAAMGADAPLTGVDNVTVELGSGDLYVAEDGGNMELVLLTPELEVAPFLRVSGHDTSEITGPAFSPDGTRLYFSSQRGVDGEGLGMTFEVTGPFRGAELREAPGSTTVPPSAPTTLRAAGNGEAAAPATAGDEDGPPVALLVGGGAVVVGAAVAGAVALRRRGEGPAT